MEAMIPISLDVMNGEMLASQSPACLLRICCVRGSV